MNLIINNYSNNLIKNEDYLSFKFKGEIENYIEILSNNIVITNIEGYDFIKSYRESMTIIVITKNILNDKSILTAYSFDHAAVKASNLQLDDVKQGISMKEVFVIGSKEIYRESIDWIDILYHRYVDIKIENNEYIPFINFDKQLLKYNRLNIVESDDFYFTLTNRSELK